MRSGADVSVGESAESRQQRLEVAYAELVRIFKPRAVMAASNWANALPPARAAQSAGLPFFYEVRGFWELTRPVWRLSRPGRIRRNIERPRCWSRAWRAGPGFGAGAGRLFGSHGHGVGRFRLVSGG